ncbi:hypothetical protein SPACI_043090 [Sporomusa acidovorans DSM 3132]|uniref:Uncharacterized protein n=1 Tax=Sporomusa acidovorans (strain ATCC 49682 / DSM 3132 / Mol) TaxID=1123286 RepID=A0ABZ3J807_SPOA4|nr:hypothetical protein SPACI_28850 [Sporomusa acidovorans DSM 3132]SDD81550.1 hypothetical protein SAMN04488499_1004133 [Sporomusa acidovorans]
MSFIVIYIPTEQSKNGTPNLNEFRQKIVKTCIVTIYQPFFSGFFCFTIIIPR